ncbi:hypothetical protein BH09CHL1_BH09CHL1_22780 [soil metagenome]
MSEMEYSAPELALASAHPGITPWGLDRVYADPITAAAAINSLLESNEFENDHHSLAGAHFVLGAAHAILGDLSIAEEHLDSAERLFAENNNDLGVAHVTVRRDLVWHQREEFHKVFEAFPLALERARAHADGWLETAILSDLGMINLRMGNVPDGVDSLFAALSVAERGTYRLQENIIRMNLAGAFMDLREFEVAAVWLKQYLSSPRLSETVHNRFECTQALAVCEYELGRPERALELLDEAIRMAEAEHLEYPFGLGEASYDQGRFFVHLGKMDRAERAFNRAIANLRKANTPVAQARVVMCEWWIESIAGQFTEQTYQALVETAQEGGVASYNRAFDLHDALSRSAEALGLQKEAIFHLRESRRLVEEYWAGITERQSRVALKRYQLEDAERAAEQERQYREELARALDAAEKLNAENHELLEKLRAQSIILEQQATEDSLTGIGNRRYFDANLERELSRASEFQRSISVAFADIDNFKEINDRHSHRIGDEVLVAVAAIIRERLRNSYVYARYGGEEFAFILPEADSKHAGELAETVRSAIEQHDWESIANGLTVTLSIGLITRVGSVTPEQVISAADSLLYLAKRTGKNQVEHRVINDDSIDEHPLFARSRSDSWVIN